ncbi:ATP-binding protein [Desulforamulus aeronauticus]|uniref:AAA domain-containing protein n=1 Tax=Desulforamulus aeronauticus DSM 10349 TaxID=1121421 RepID=A0A1M6QG88_9FIRM|nr:ATP-binding protein [Desulforamulus aeronauticus]SHK19067.1 AAA domain-containing protein [Desulforamulus aeronauticus DSM 10349]
MEKESKQQQIEDGNIRKAIYSEQILDDYKGNPLIEALPPIFSEEQVVDCLTRLPSYNSGERELDAHYRYHCVNRLFSYFEPLERHIDLEQRFSRLIRQGYLGRNPLNPQYATRLQHGYRIIKSGGYDIFDDVGLGTTSSGFTIIGISGMGKTTAVNRVLQLYPRVIVHSNYKGINLSLYQLTWLKLDCPFDGSLKGLCFNFFETIDKIIGTNYFRKFGSPRNSVEFLLSRMAQIASAHCLGMLIIDEIQHLSLAKSGGSDKMLNFFVTLVNTIGVPVVLIGTTKALSVVQGEFRQARRGSGQGDNDWSRFKRHGEWDLLVEGMWGYQWTKEISPLTDEIIEVFYYESQGIIDIAIKLFILSQWRAITHGEEVITAETIRTVAEDSLKLVKPMIDALKSGDPKKIAKYDDIRPIDMESFYEDYSTKLESRKHTRSNNPKEQFIREISLRLTSVGIGSQVARESARKVVERGECDGDIILATNAALALALPTGTVKSKPDRKKNEPNDLEDLRLIVKNGRELKKSAYESLREMGYIKSPLGEFIEAI